MASSSKSTQPPKASHPPFAPAGSNASIFLEKSRPGVRRSTPDSEALASSDDEVDHHHHNHTPAAPVAKPARRTSWLNEVPAALPKRTSLTASSSLSPVNSNPTTPATDQTSWGATSPSLGTSMTWGPSGSASFPWGTGIWNSDSRKEPPPRLAEVLQSPTASNPPNSNGNSADEIISPTARAMPGGDSSIPFAIPLHPTPKTYRSQSYSVGQLDPDSANVTPNKPAAPLTGGRTRNGVQYSSVQRRSSRPSMLGELGHDHATLGRVREDEDDDGGSANGSEGGFHWSANQARTIEQLTLENAFLRQAASSQLDSSRFRDRAMSSASANSGYSVTGTHSLHRIQGSVPEETDLAVEDLDELRDFPGYNTTRSSARRRFSEHSTNLEKQFPTFASLDSRTRENIKKTQWQTSLGFAGIPEVSQSRRHSFADIPARHASAGSSSDSQAQVGSVHGRDDGYGNYVEGALNTSPTENSSYFSGHDHSVRANEAVASSGISTSLHQAYVMPNAFGRQHSTLAQPQQNQQLFIVTFKCCRADVFYVQEDTGLQVKPGELVIVEADRGTDLGTVAHANVPWAKAREYKEHYAEEHYKWLMLFSRQNQTGGPNTLNPNGTSSALNGAPGSAVGGMGPQGQHGIQEPQGGDIKPKLIKRLAQNHEIQTLRDKEGNEAKAKRVCQQKVAEHRLNMEILDAEFQMDWKKLTFYYFADAYINFNSLVTDLFKIYKTRIWMSAINPASFVTPTAGLQPPGGVNPVALGYCQDTHADRRRQHDYKSFGSANQGLASQGIFADSVGRDASTGAGGGLRSPCVDPYQAFASTRQPELALAGYAPGLPPQTDPFSSYPSSTYGILDPNLADYSAGFGGVRRTHPTHGDWVTHFQGLSLGS